MFTIIIERDGQPIRALTTPDRTRARRTAAKWKAEIRSRCAHHDSTYAVALIAPAGRGR